MIFMCIVFGWRARQTAKPSVVDPCTVRWTISSRFWYDVGKLFAVFFSELRFELFGAPPIRIQRPRRCDTHRSSPSAAVGQMHSDLAVRHLISSWQRQVPRPPPTSTSAATTLICLEESLVPFYRLTFITETAAPPEAWPRPLSPLCVQVTELPTQSPPPNLLPTPTTHIPFVNLSDSDTKHFGVTSTCCLRPPLPPSLLHSWQLRIVGKNVCWAHSKSTNQNQSAPDETGTAPNWTHSQQLRNSVGLSIHCDGVEVTWRYSSHHK